MAIHAQFEMMFRGVDQRYRRKFIDKTDELLETRATALYRFIDGSLSFDTGEATWVQDLPIIDPSKPLSAVNPVSRPELPVRSGEHAYELFKEYLASCWFFKERGLERGNSDLERYVMR